MKRDAEFYQSMAGLENRSQRNADRMAIRNCLTLKRRRKKNKFRTWEEHEKLITEREDIEWIRKQLRLFDSLPKEQRAFLRDQ